MPFRIYIDESGDDFYKGMDAPGRRYLGLTGVVFRKAAYDPAIPLEMETLKRRHFTFDADYPVALHRKDILQKKSHYWVLQDESRNREWEDDLLTFLSGCPMQLFTVVFDKKAHVEEYGEASTNPYVLGLTLLLECIRTWVASQQEGSADVMLESRGAKKDSSLQSAYDGLRDAESGWQVGGQFSAVYPAESLLFRSKEHNIAGLQIADLIVAEQTRLTIQEFGRPSISPIGPFGERMNDAIDGKVTPGGRRMLQ